MIEDAISVIIPLYNQARWVREAVESALNQTHPPLEIVVIDDGSTDGGAVGLAAMDRRVKVIHQTNAGVARARNAGAASALGSYLAFLDSDDTWHQEKLELQMDAFRSRPESCVVHCGLEIVGDDDVLLGTSLDGASGLVAEELFLRTKWLLGASSTTLIPRRIFNSIGGFDPRFSVSADWDLSLRLAELGPVVFVPKPLVRYRSHEGGMHRQVDAMCSDALAVIAAAIRRDPDRYGRLRRRALAASHINISGSYLHANRGVLSLCHLAKAVAFHPGSAGYALGIVARRRVARAC